MSFYVLSDFIGVINKSSHLAGTLSKCNSFSTAHTKPKPKLVDEVFRKQKSMQNPALPRAKEGSSREMGKSVSSKLLDSDHLRHDESKAKMLSPKFSQSQDLEGFKIAKEQNFAKRRSSFEFEHSVASSTIASSTIFSQRVDQTPVSGSELISFCMTNKLEPKTLLTDSKLEPPTPVNHASWVMEEPVLYGMKHCFTPLAPHVYAYTHTHDSVCVHDPLQILMTVCFLVHLIIVVYWF